MKFIFVLRISYFQIEIINFIQKNFLFISKIKVSAACQFYEIVGFGWQLVVISLNI